MKPYFFQKERYKKRALRELSRAGWNVFYGRKIKNIPALIILTFFLVMGYLFPSPKGPIVTGNATVIDGDTLQVNGQRFRLYGIDAPESKQMCTREDHVYSCGEEATLALKRFVVGNIVICEQKDIDKYNRIVAICWVGEKELNKLMVEKGHAVSYRQYTGRYLIDEMKARLNRAGLWSGSFQMPWEYRHKNRVQK